MLEQFSAHLLKWNKAINLISKSHANVADIWNRHVIDSAQLVKFIPENAKTITDFGSGAGLPGIVLAIIGGYHVNLIESDQRKCAFLTEIATFLPIKISVHNKRIEEIIPWESDVLTARALASLDKLFEITLPFIDKSKLCIFLKGQNIVEEIEVASNSWDFQCEIQPSVSDSQGRVLILTNINHKGGR